MAHCFIDYNSGQIKRIDPAITDFSLPVANIDMSLRCLSDCKADKHCVGGVRAVATVGTTANTCDLDNSCCGGCCFLTAACGVTTVNGASGMITLAAISGQGLACQAINCNYFCNVLAGGTTGQIQYNCNNGFCGAAGLCFNASNNSVAMGASSASGNCSHAEGSSCTYGCFSHAEGLDSCAVGHYSHAEGGCGKAINMVSHVEGFCNWACGSGTPGIHVEGFCTRADCIGAHAEGFCTVACGIGAHSEGSACGVTYNWADGCGAHVEGFCTCAYCTGAHAEGFYACVCACAAHAEGFCTCACCAGSHAENWCSKALGIASHAEGTTCATNLGAHAEGGVNLASQIIFSCACFEASHVEGFCNCACNCATHIEGVANCAIGLAAHMEGMGCTSSCVQIAHGDYSHVEGYTNRNIFGLAGHTEGCCQCICNDAVCFSHVEGFQNLLSSCSSNTRCCSCCSVGTKTGTGYWWDFGANWGVIKLANPSTITGCLSCNCGGTYCTAQTLAFHPNGFCVCASGTNNTCIIGSTTSSTLVPVYFHQCSSTFSSGGGCVFLPIACTDGCNVRLTINFQMPSQAHAVHVEGCWQGNYGAGNPADKNMNALHMEGCCQHINMGCAGHPMMATHMEGFCNGTCASIGFHIEGTCHCVGTCGHFSHLEGAGPGYTPINCLQYAHVEGYKNCSLGGTAVYTCGLHLEGFCSAICANNATCIVCGAHTEGGLSCVGGIAAHAEGYGSKALGFASHAEGCCTSACNNYSHSEGKSTIAGNATASINVQHAEGSLTAACGFASHAEGNLTTAFGMASHAEGASTVSGSGDFQGPASHAEGLCTTTCTLWYAHAEGCCSCICSLGHAGHAEGCCTQVCSCAGHAEGAWSKSLNTAAHAEGKGTFACQDSSHAEGFCSCAKCQSSHAEGCCSLADACHSHAEGRLTFTCSPSSHTEGVCSFILANSCGGHVEGFCTGLTTTGAKAGHAEGCCSLARTAGQHAAANCGFSTLGDAQYSRYVFKAQTINAAPVTLATDSVTGYGMIMPGSKATIMFTIRVAAHHCTGNTAAGWYFRGTLVNTDGTLRFINNSDVAVNSWNNLGVGSTVTLSTSSFNPVMFNIAATGVEANTINWVAVMETSEVSVA